MNKNKTYTERTFNKLFQKKEKLLYEFDTNEMSRRDRKIIKLLSEFGVKGKHCLDIGPGTGRWLQFLKKQSASYLGAIDISQESLDRCEILCDKTQKADVENEPCDYESDYFDIVISFMILEHLRDPENYISEIARVTKNNGIILMTIPNIVSFMSRIRVIFGIMPQAITSDKTHVKFYTEKELIKLFKPFNLKPIMIPTSFSINPFNSKKPRVPSSRIIKSLDDHLLFVVQKSKK